MMIKGMVPSDENQKGFVFIVCILLLFVLTIAGIATVRTSGTEVLTVRNQGQMIREFYNAETGLIDAFENPGPWLMDNAFMTGAALTSPSNTNGWHGHDTVALGQKLASYRVRCIDAVGTTPPSITGLTDFENDVPAIQHIAPPPINSGYSMKHFEVRRYAVTSKSATGNSIVQGGVWKVFNKFN